MGPVDIIHIIYGCVAELSCSLHASLACPTHVVRPTTSLTQSWWIAVRRGVVIVAHHPIMGRLQPGGEGCQLIRCQYIDASEESLVGRLVAVDIGTAPRRRVPWHQQQGRKPAQHQTHSVGGGKRDLHTGVGLQVAQVGTTSHRFTALSSPVITTHPANIYDLMLVRPK